MTGTIDLMSLDIDGNDYWIWKALNIVKPRVVIAEYNCLWGPDKSVTIPYEPKFIAPRNPNPLIPIHSVDYCGASLLAFKKLAEAFGINGYYAENSIELKKALISAISDGGAALIEVKVDKNLEKSPWKYILMTY